MTTRNITTLSLITIAILSLNGCGGDSTPTKSSEQSVSSITKLSEASQKHSDTDWEVLTGQITDLDKPEKFNTMLEGSIEKNIVALTSVGIDKEVAYAMNSDHMYDDLVELQIEDLDNEVLTECKEDDNCKEEAYASIGIGLGIDKEVAYAMAEDFHKENNTTLVNDGLVKEFTCDAGEVKTVQHYGLEDSFSTANGAEPSTPAPHIALVPWIANYPFPLTGYDEVSANRIFAETVKNLPANVVKGNFYIGFKSNGTALQGNDTMTFGNYANNDVKTIPLNTLNWTTTAAGGTTIFSNSFNNIDTNNSTLLQMVKNNQQFDVVVQDDTSVDFITVATCSKKDPIREISSVVNKFECSEKETMMKILGGKIDALAPSVDTATPSTSLDGNVNYYQLTGYDQTHPNKTLLDTLDLSNVSGTITKAEFNMGYKSLGNPLTGNDTVHIGEYGVNHSGGRYILYPNGTNVDEPLWAITSISNGEIVRKVNLADISPTATPTMTMLDWIQGKSAFDVVVEDDTAVDFAQLNLCVKKSECDESAKEYKIDLSQLASWTEKPSDAEENSVGNPNVWAADMNWIKFDSDGKERILKIPFCACGNTLVNIEHLKGDNIAEITLDTTSVAYQPWSTNNVAGFIADSAGGNHVDGSQAITGTGVGVNHVLELNATNLYSSSGHSTPFGVAVEGTLSFKGNLGKCK